MKQAGTWARAVTRLGKREIGLVATLFCVAALLLEFGLHTVVNYARSVSVAVGSPLR